MNTNEYPRLLIVSPSAFNALSGGGITFTNLFWGWPKDRIATVHSDSVPTTTDVCEKYFKLSNREFPWMFPFSLAAHFGGQEKVERTLKFSGAAESVRAQIKRKVLSLAEGIGRMVFGDEIPMRAHLSDELREWIRAFRPQVLYTILGSLQYIRLVRTIADEFHLPVVIHMMDDWPAVIYRRGIFGYSRRRSMQKELKGMVERAAACLSICDAMSEAYEKRYRRPFIAFHNAIDAHAWLEKSRREWKAGVPFTVVYAGALIHNSQVNSVRDVSDAVARLHKEGQHIEFRIYAPWYMANKYRSELEREGCVSVYDAPDAMDIESLFARADLLLLPVNFDEASVKYIRYSMPTKVPAYMFSGTPTLAYGPESVASIQYAQKEKWAHCVVQRDPQLLNDAIRQLASDEKLREHYATRAQHLAQKRHDRAEVSEKFHQILIEASHKSPSV